MAEGFIRRVLQAEGLALLLASLAAYHWLGQSWWMFALLCLAPDLAFVGFVWGPRVGSIAYNTLHSTLGPFALMAIAWWLNPQPEAVTLAAIAAIWFAHIGVDRLVGYGLKYGTGFKDTHLGKLR
jgi:Domain of unknown function (DUF4260)